MENHVAKSSVFVLSFSGQEREAALIKFGSISEKLLLLRGDGGSFLVANGKGGIECTLVYH